MLTNENYFSLENNLKYMGVSQFKSFESCQASAYAEVTGNYERELTPSLLIGSYVDAHFEGTLDIFKSKHPQIFKRDGSLKAEYLNAEKIIGRIEQDEMFMDYMSGRKQVVMTGVIQNVPVKIKVDSLHDDKIVDLKVMKDFLPVYKNGQGKLNFIEAWGYDLQGAVYQEIVRQNTGKRLPFFIAAATKEKEPDIAIFEVSQDYLDIELQKFKENVLEYDAIKKGLVEPERCEHCNYCKMTKVLKEVVSIEELDYYE